MPYTPPPPSPEWLQLRAILKAVEQHLLSEAKVAVTCYFMSQTPKSPSLGYISFQPFDLNEKSFKQEPGIPKDALHKTIPIAEWIVRQVSKRHPEWFK